MIMLDIILFLVTVYFAYTTFTTVSKARGSEEEQFIDDVVDEKIIICKTEIVGNRIYVWNKLTNDFIVNGSSIQDVVEYFKKHHPGKKIVLLENENDKEDRT